MPLTVSDLCVLSDLIRVMNRSLSEPRNCELAGQHPHSPIHVVQGAAAHGETEASSLPAASLASRSPASSTRNAGSIVHVAAHRRSGIGAPEPPTDGAKAGNRRRTHLHLSVRT